VGVGILDDVASAFSMTERIHRGPQGIALKAPSNRIKVILFNNNDSEQTTLSILRALTVTEAAKSGDIH
jgi:hypothetical protein